MFRKKDRTTLDSAAPAKSTGTLAGKAASGKPGSVKGAIAKVAPVKAAAAKPASARSTAPVVLSKGQKAYEARRAEKAGMGLDKWMAEKDRRVQAEHEALQRAHKKVAPSKPGLLRRLLDKAHRPI